VANTQIACTAALCRFNQQGALCTLAEIIIQPQHAHAPAGGAGREVHPYCASFDPLAKPR
jgi:hypothetical protein